jgi:hypothetical protein
LRQQERLISARSSAGEDEQSAGRTISDGELCEQKDWTRQALERTGFVGWVPWSSGPASLSAIDPTSGGVYVIYRAGALEPAYLDQSPAGRFRGVAPIRASHGDPNGDQTGESVFLVDCS